MDQIDNFYYLVVLAIFITISLFFSGLFFLWQSYRSRDAIRIDNRLKAVSDSWTDTAKAQFIKQRVLSESAILDAQLRKISIAHKLDQLILQSGIKITVSKLIIYMILIGTIGLFVSNLVQSLFGVVFSLIAAILPLLYLIYLRNKRLSKIEQQLPDLIDLMARSLRAGHAFSGALQMAASESPEPIAKEFQLAFDEVNYGNSIQDSLMHLCVRVPITDLRYFVIAVLIQRESGGNLAELLGSISSLIRARLKLLGTIRVLSAEGRMSGWILAALPFGLGFILQLINPGYLDILFSDPAGSYLIGGMVTLMVIGGLIIMKIVKIRV